MNRTGSTLAFGIKMWAQKAALRLHHSKHVVVSTHDVQEALEPFANELSTPLKGSTRVPREHSESRKPVATLPTLP